MSASFLAMMTLVGSSVVIAFVLQPSEEELPAPASAPLPPHRCQREPLQSIRKILLGKLNLDSEPQLPAGGLDLIRKRWRTALDTIPRAAAADSAVPAVADPPASAAGENSTGLKCCPLASEVVLTDLGWDSWVIHPRSFSVLTCALCDHQGTIVQCPSSQSSPQDADSQPNCCQPTSMETVEVVYVDQHSTVTMASMQLPSRCSCGRGDAEPASVE